MAQKEYGNDSISSLKGADRVRLRPAAILGSDGLEGCQHTFIEILANSIDEAREGFGDVIEVTRFKDRSIEVRDYGRGCPVDYNEKKRYNWNWSLRTVRRKIQNKPGHQLSSVWVLTVLVPVTQYIRVHGGRQDGYKYELHLKKAST